MMKLALKTKILKPQILMKEVLKLEVLKQEVLKKNLFGESMEHWRSQKEMLLYWYVLEIKNRTA
jgi:hypothetical protein